MPVTFLKSILLILAVSIISACSHLTYSSYISKEGANTARITFGGTDEWAEDLYYIRVNERDTCESIQVIEEKDWKGTNIVAGKKFNILHGARSPNGMSRCEIAISFTPEAGATYLSEFQAHGNCYLNFYKLGSNGEKIVETVQREEKLTCYLKPL